MSEKKFQWDDAALVPDTVTINFSPLMGDKDDAPVVFYELPRKALVDFVEESINLQIYETEEDGKTLKLTGTEGAMKPIKRAFHEIEKDSSAYIFKYLALASRGKKKDSFFAGLELTSTAMGKLCEMLLEINHVSEIIATSGNWMMLPTMLEMYAEARAKDESVSPAATTPA